MSDGRLSTYLEQISQAANDALDFVEGLSKDDFLTDKRTQQAVVLSLFIVGETATKVLERYAEFAATHPAIPWQSMKGMRNRIAHGYFEINFEVVWETVQSSLPALLRQLNNIAGRA